MNPPVLRLLRQERPEAIARATSLLESANPAEDFLSPEDWVEVAQQFGLSQREMSVAVLLFEGQSRYQIARRLGCSAGTTRVYIDRLYRKMCVADRVGLVLRVARAHVRLSRE